jgi:hypothetical protein
MIWVSGTLRMEATIEIESSDPVLSLGLRISV